MNVKRSNILITADKNRVLLRPFLERQKERSEKIIRRILSLSPEDTKDEVQKVHSRFTQRHRDLDGFFLQRFNQKDHLVPPGVRLSHEQKLLIGAYFSCEYSLEAAALFNPCLICHPDQSGLQEGSRRFIISLRATGEGHISSIVFRTGVIDSEGTITLYETTRLASPPSVQSNGAGYTARFNPLIPLSERVLFPATAAEKGGMEDARFVEFRGEDGNRKYYATYTAYNGRTFSTWMIETEDFSVFNMMPLKGAAVDNKGMALFPRMVNGRYAMLSRQDNENNFIMFSDDLYRWESKALLMAPNDPWDFVQVGNCGSPIETEKGWLVLSHGVGAMRKYVISAFMLDLQDPTRVVGRLKKPLLSPNEDEREGYVPNVVYSCGSQVHHDYLIIPYGMSDSASGFALINLEELLEELSH